MGTEPRDDYAYTGLHAYALVHDVTVTTQAPDRNASGFIRQLQGMAEPVGPVTAAVEVAGTFKGLVQIVHDERHRKTFEECAKICPLRSARRHSRESPPVEGGSFPVFGGDG